MRPASSPPATLTSSKPTGISSGHRREPRAIRGRRIAFAVRSLFCHDHGRMRIPFRHDLRLKPSILASFLLLTLPVFATIIAVTYISNERIARSNARELVERFRIDGIENIQANLATI